MIGNFSRLNEITKYIIFKYKYKQIRQYKAMLKKTKSIQIKQDQNDTKNINTNFAMTNSIIQNKNVQADNSLYSSDVVNNANPTNQPQRQTFTIKKTTQSRIIHPNTSNNENIQIQMNVINNTNIINRSQIANNKYNNNNNYNSNNSNSNISKSNITNKYTTNNKYNTNTNNIQNTNMKNQSTDSIYDNNDHKSQLQDQVNDIGIYNSNNNNNRNKNNIDIRDINMIQTQQAKINYSVSANKPAFRSQTGLASSMYNSQNIRLPASIRASIRMLASGKHKQQEKPKKYQMTNTLIKKYKQLKKDATNKFTCQICSCQYEQIEITKIGKCSHSFCDSCLRHYVDYKIARFQQVACPAENCPQILDTDGAFYKTLNESLKEKYNKVHTFYVAANNPNNRLCPNQTCKNGILTWIQTNPPTCNKCGNVYCAQCFFPKHDGPCQKNQVDFFQNNLHFRQCSNCKSVVQKNQGCNHITCRCKYQFCYLCGAKWTGYDHKCGVAPTNLLVAGGAQPQPNNNNNNVEEGCCQGNGCCSIFLRGLLKVFVQFPIFLVLASLIIILSLVTIVAAFALTLLMGLFPYTWEIICDKDCPAMGLLILIYPFTMFLGIGAAFQDFYCDIAGDIIQTGCENLRNAADCLLGC